MLEVRQGGRSCTILFKSLLIAECDEFFLEDLCLDEAGSQIEVNGARFIATEIGIVLDPGPNVMALKPHKGLRIMWDGSVLFRKDENDRVSFELLASSDRAAA
jgi:hypothetical protein